MKRAYAAFRVFQGPRGAGVKGWARMGAISSTLVPTLGMTMRFGEMLTKDIPASEFARVPSGVRMNSPAFCFGHVTIYADRVLDLVGRSDVASHDQRWTDLFSFGKECVDDPNASVYPTMGEIMDRFRARNAVVKEVLPTVGDEVMLLANPNERMREWLPTVGAQVAFLIGGHAMSHLGQVSAWRRIKGLGSAMG